MQIDGQGNDTARCDASFDNSAMIDLPDFAPLRTSSSVGTPTRASLDRLDHLLVVTAGRSTTLGRLPLGRQLTALLARTTRDGEEFASSRAANRRATGMTVGAFGAPSTFAALTWARKALRECMRDRPRSLGVAFAGLDAAAERRAADALLAAAGAAAFTLPAFKSTAAKRTQRTLTELRLFQGNDGANLAEARAQSLGNNVARWFTALPPNVLTVSAYRQAIERLAKPRGIRSRFYGEAQLRKLGAGAFLAVARGNATRDAGILRLSYRPPGRRSADVALVGKGVLFDTGGTNLKTFAGMLDMHTDMQGSAVALGTLLALADLEAPFGADAWLAITENRLGPDAYKPQDLITALDGTTIQVIHTDAEGRMVLADTLALAARERPAFIVDYATLTGSCVAALTERYSGVFSNRRTANELLQQAGETSGERVWPFPMDDDFDELLKSEVADVKQCSTETAGDHILGARFLNRFVPKTIPWVHVDLSAAAHKGGLAHIPTEITGFGVRLTLTLLLRLAAGPRELARMMA